MLKDKCILLGVTGSIAAYKIANLASMLVKQHADVNVLMTQNATNFITPITFETLTGHKCLVDTFDRNFEYSVEHVSLAKKADCVLIAPATANVIAKMANGLADDMLTTTVLACKCRKIVSPAMNTNMYQNPITQDNLKKLSGYGFQVITPELGHLACGDEGIGKMPSEQELFEAIVNEVRFPKDLLGKKVLVTAGPTREAIDPVRFLSNHSTGKMGYAIARAALQRGAKVTLVSGPVAITPPKGAKVVFVQSADEMLQAVKAEYEAQDVIIKAAAVADFRPVHVAEEKIKKKSTGGAIPLEKTTDILAFLGAHKREGTVLCGFSMETQSLIENSKKKLEEKSLDMIVANNLKTEGAGFAADTNVVTIITKDGVCPLQKMSKDEVAGKILDVIKQRFL